MNRLPVVLVTGSSGYLGSAICVDLCRDHMVLGLDRRPPSRDLRNQARGAEWGGVDITHARSLVDWTSRMGERYGGVDVVIHLAAFYHYGKRWLPEYGRINVAGLRNTLDAAVAVNAKRFVFAGSIASLPPPPPGRMLTEKSTPVGQVAYARSKALGETMLMDYHDRIPCVSLRIGGVFSDWCELPPLYSLIRMWSSPMPSGRMVPGQGTSGFPYIHRDDLVRAVRKVLQASHRLAPLERLFAAPSGCTLHRELFPLIREGMGFDSAARPIFVPPVAAGMALFIRNRFKVLLGQRRYERRWMLDYVDRPLIVDAGYTHALLDWRPSSELGVLQRLPVLMRHFNNDRQEWEKRNIRRNEGRYDYQTESSGGAG
ncbi:MAG: NAD-dependent epimerase/dehydratase family protein [Thermodesulfobacteriota bacterium]